MYNSQGTVKGKSELTVDERTVKNNLQFTMYSVQLKTKTQFKGK